MFEIDIRLLLNDGQQTGFTTERCNMSLAYMSAIQNVKHQLQTNTIDFVPIEGGEYLIWAYGKCQGTMAVKEVDPETEAQDSKEG